MYGTRMQVYGDKLLERLAQMAQSGLAVTINSDDAAYFGAYLSENFEWLAQMAGLNVRQVAQLVVNGFQASFSLPKSAGGAEKRDRFVEAIWQMAAQAEAELAAEAAAGLSGAAEVAAVASHKARVDGLEVAEGAAGNRGPEGESDGTVGGTVSGRVAKGVSGVSYLRGGAMSATS
jgi:hypothetical protein